MTEEFIGEAIQPLADTLDTSRMAAGGPGLPRQFRWRSEIVSITRVLNTWRNRPLPARQRRAIRRKHWFEVATDSGLKMKIYFERQARSANKKKDRWWLFSTERLDQQKADIVDLRQEREINLQ